ncbi:MAG TPA: PadR family transcriptional regulator [Longimicrobiales bacterium]|nr:PadR family transcriptional regulator [Longimicrobiales bacterium]
MIDTSHRTSVPLTVERAMAQSHLNPPVFHILLALARGDLHGLGIADRVEEATGGAVELGPGTLYRSLKEMLREGLIREAEPPAGSDPRRKYYAMTAAGRRQVAAEAARLEALVELARAESLLQERA